jgi:hypothetical protein
MNWIIFIVGCVLSAMFGGCTGLIIASMLMVAKKSDEDMERVMNTYESN